MGALKLEKPLSNLLMEETWSQIEGDVRLGSVPSCPEPKGEHIEQITASVLTADRWYVREDKDIREKHIPRIASTFIEFVNSFKEVLFSLNCILSFSMCKIDFKEIWTN